MASLTPTHDLPTITEGDDVTIPVTFVKQNGSPVDISGWTTSLTIAEQTRGQQGGGTVIIQKDVSPADATGGKTNFHLDPADTAGLSGPKRYDIQVTQDNSVVKTVVLGTVAFVDGVTDRDITSSGPPGTTGSLTADGIEVTMADGDISVSVSVAGAFSAADVFTAISGSTIEPQQVGTQSNPVEQEYVKSSNVDELSVGNPNKPTTGIGGDAGEVHLIGQVDMGSGGPRNITATTFDTFVYQVGVVDLQELATNTTLKLRFAGNIGNGTAGESITVRPVVSGYGPITNLEISTTGNTSVLADSGWHGLPQPSSDGISTVSYQAEVSGATGLAWPNLTLFVGREIQ